MQRENSRKGPFVFHKIQHCKNNYFRIEKTLPGTRNGKRLQAERTYTDKILPISLQFDSTYSTPFDDGESGHAKKRSSLRYRDSPAFHDIFLILYEMFG